MADRNIISLKYGTRYSADYVNVLFNTCRKAMQGPFRFVCLTDDPKGLVAGIEALPIPDVGLTPQEWYRGGIWPKLGIYDRALHGLTGRCLFIDLDMVVVSDLDAFFAQKGTFIGINETSAWGRDPYGAPKLCSAIIAFDAGSLPHLAEGFTANKAEILSIYRTEQDYTAATLPVITYWPDDWVISFKRKLRRPIGLDLLLPPREPPPGTKVLAFHGTPRPIDLISREKLFWDRFPHLGHGRVSWMARYWVDNGGTLP
jgi:hypothetical protein